MCDKSDLAVPDGDIVYRISWTNANQGEEMCDCDTYPTHVTVGARRSTVGNVKIEITGAGGETTGELVVLPSPLARTYD